MQEELITYATTMTNKIASRLKHGDRVVYLRDGRIKSHSTKSREAHYLMRLHPESIVGVYTPAVDVSCLESDIFFALENSS